MTNHPTHPHEPTPDRELTRTQRQALDWLRDHPTDGQWPSQRGTYYYAARWSQRTLQALVDSGHAVWRGSTYETPVAHGVMPYVTLLDRSSSNSRQHWIDTGRYLTVREARDWSSETPVMPDGVEHEITHTYPNSAVNVRVTLTYTAGGERVAAAVTRELHRELVKLAGTAHVPAVTPQMGVSQ